MQLRIRKIQADREQNLRRSGNFLLEYYLESLGTVPSITFVITTRGCEKRFPECKNIIYCGVLGITFSFLRITTKVIYQLKLHFLYSFICCPFHVYASTCVVGIVSKGVQHSGLFIQGFHDINFSCSSPCHNNARILKNFRIRLFVSPQANIEDKVVLH